MTDSGPLLRICVTGPESTGKTVLAARLASHLGTAWVPEASRRYAEWKGAPLDATDVEPIARAQVELDVVATAEAHALGARVLVLDTDLLSTMLYADHYYGVSSAWIAEAATRRQAQLYLLCDVDVPWVADGVRDSPDNRDAMHARFAALLGSAGARTVLVRGDWDARWETAWRAAQALLGE